MKTTATQGLPFPTGLDYGAGARQMQDLAEALEGEMNAVDAGWALRRNPPTWIASTTVSQAPAAPVPLTIAWHQVDFDNTGVLAPINSGTSTQGKLTATPGRVELWWVGAYMTIVQNGTILGFRRGQLLITSIDPVTGARQLQSITQTGYETLTTNENFTWQGFVRVNAEARVELRAYTNLGAVNAGAVMWATRVGQE